jgi:hypothetical protein
MGAKTCMGRAYGTGMKMRPVLLLPTDAVRRYKDRYAQGEAR